MPEKPVAPDHLGDRGRAVWAAIIGDYDLRPDELVTLEDAAGISDMIDALSAAWEDQGRPLTTKGSMGQQVIHPLIGEIRTQRAARNALWRQLKLPDLDDSDGTDRLTASEMARKAARARWDNRGR